MTSIDQLAAAYRALRCHHIAAGLPALLAQAEANELSYLHLAEQLVELERQGRARNRLALNLTKAGFPAIKRLEEFDFRHQTTITKRQINQLLDFRFLDERANLVFIGPPGVGKMHLAIAIALKAVEAGYKALFTTALTLVEALEIAELKGELKRKIASLLKFDLLVMDELGLPAHEPTGRLQPLPAYQRPLRVPLRHPHHQQGLHQLGRIPPRGRRRRPHRRPPHPSLTCVYARRGKLSPEAKNR
jgi:DNA replication protein DnaC